MKYPKTIEELIHHYSMFPGIGKKTAERLALFTISELKQDDILAMIHTLGGIQEKIKYCNVCGLVTEEDICDVCRDASRDVSKILVVEDHKDVFIIEKINEYNGLYHVLGGVLSPIDGIGPQELSIKELINRLKDENVTELIIATSATVEGESTALYLGRILEKSEILITRIAHGLPVGGGIEFADQLTLSRALEGRRKI